MSGDNQERHSIIEIDVDQEITRIIRQLDSLTNRVGAARILQEAINNAAVNMRQQMIAKAKERYALKKKGKFNKESQVEKSTGGKIEAFIVSKGTMLDIMDFSTRKNSKGNAASAKVLRSGSVKPLDKDGLKAFVTKFASNHVAVVRRVPGQLYTVQGQNKRFAKYWRKYGFKIDMTRIEKILSPSVPLMLGKEEVRGVAQANTYENLQAEIQRHIDQVLGANGRR